MATVRPIPTGWRLISVPAGWLPVRSRRAGLWDYRLNPRSCTVSAVSASWGLSPSPWSRSPFGPVAQATQPEPRMAGSASRGPHTTPRSVQSDGLAAIAPFQDSVSPLAAMRRLSPIRQEVPVNVWLTYCTIVWHPQRQGGPA